MVVQHMKMQFWSKKSKFKNFFWGGHCFVEPFTHTLGIVNVSVFVVVINLLTLL